MGHSSIDYTKLARAEKVMAQAKKDKRKSKTKNSKVKGKVYIDILEDGIWSKISGHYPVTLMGKLTSYPVKGAWFARKKRKGWDGRSHLMSKATKKFPTGLVPIIKEELKKYEYRVFIRNHQEMINLDLVIPKRLLSKEEEKVFEFRDYQIECMQVACKKGRGVLHLATNAGKTAIACGITKAFGTSFKMLFLVKGLELLDQTRTMFSERLGIPIDQIGQVGDSVHTFGDWITVASPDTLSKKLTDVRFRQFFSSVKLLFVDECHSLASKSFYSVLLAIPAPYRFGMSGTPLYRSDEADLKLIAQTGPVIFRISNKELIEQGVSVPTKIEFTTIKIPKLPHYLAYQEAYSKGIVENSYRNKKICDKAYKRFKEGRKILILIRQIKHGHILDEMLWTLKKTSFIPHQFISGKESMDVRREALSKFRRGEIPILISNVILDQGVDISGIDALILGGSGKAKIGALQRLGRGMRTGSFDDLVVDEFSDMTHHYLTKHSLERFNLYKKEKAFTIVQAT